MLLLLVAASLIVVGFVVAIAIRIRQLERVEPPHDPEQAHVRTLRRPFDWERDA